MSIFQGAMKTLVGCVTAAAGIDATYKRGELEVPVRLIPKEITVRTDTMDGGVIETTFRRYIAEKSKLLLAPDTPVTPEIGDIVIEPDGRAYRVCIFQGETAWNDHDLSGVNIQFHATEITHNNNDGPETTPGNAGTGAAASDGGFAAGGYVFA